MNGSQSPAQTARGADPARNIEVSQAAHRGDERPMREVLSSLLSSLLETLDAAEAQRLAAAAFPSPPRLHTQHTTAVARRYTNPSHRARRHRGR